MMRIGCLDIFARLLCKKKKKKKKKTTTNPATTNSSAGNLSGGACGFFSNNPNGISNHNFSARTKGRRKKEFNFGEDASGPKKVQVPVLSLLVRKKRKEKKTPMVIGDLGAARLIHQ